MADVKGIATWIANEIEDDQRHPGIAKDLGDGAGITRYGITQRWHANDVPADFFTTMLPAVANLVAIAFYTKWANTLSVGSIDSDDIAACLLSFAVNDNNHVAVRTLQEVLEVNPDGALGPITIAELNQKDPVMVAKLYRAAWTTFYMNEVAAHPAKADFLKGWLNRVKRIYPS